ncbi:hypothetical protein B0H21DRAFT_5195 [Amylocystis lapponica]|nr:hypothetical protein B0H21DRAFT_5195 [Amylocystis lapponica]
MKNSSYSTTTARTLSRCNTGRLWSIPEGIMWVKGGRMKPVYIIQYCFCTYLGSGAVYSQSWNDFLGPSPTTKWSFGQNTPHPIAWPAPAMMLPLAAHDDVPMHTDNDDDEGGLSEGAPPHTLVLACPRLSTEFAVFVFTPIHGTAPKAHTVSAQKMPPDVFVPDSNSGSNGESEPEQCASVQSIPGSIWRTESAYL